MGSCNILSELFLMGVTYIALTFITMLYCVATNPWDQLCCLAGFALPVLVLLLLPVLLVVLKPQDASIKAHVQLGNKHNKRRTQVFR